MKQRRVNLPCYTSRDAWNAGIAATWKAPTAAERRASLDRERLAYAAGHPSIGVLIRTGRPLFYVTAPSYRESRDPRALVIA